MSKVTVVPLGSVKPNPFRLLKQYPYNEAKIAALQRSIGGVGMWEGVIARRNGEVYEIAFGHHRIEAARRQKLREVPLIVRTLTDEQMLQFMGRENGEDYKTDFPVLLETWEAAAKFEAGRARAPEKPIDIARILGWVRKSERGDGRMNDAAIACATAHQLIEDGHITRTDLVGVDLRTAEEIVRVTSKRIHEVEKNAKQYGHSETDVKQAKKQIAEGAKRTAKKARDGKVSSRKAAQTVDMEAFGAAQEGKRQTPVWETFAVALIRDINDVLADDKKAEKLAEVEKALGIIDQPYDKKLLRDIDTALQDLGERVDEWRERIKPARGWKAAEVRPMLTVAGGR